MTTPHHNPARHQPPPRPQVAGPLGLWRALRAAATGLGLALLCSCQMGGPAGDDALPDMRRPTWWGFYARGLALSRRERWRAAVEQFETAIGTRAGAIYGDPTDRRRAKTYGLHFLNDYFPHREIGVCLYYQGDYPAAEAELLRSLDMNPSARARYYLNEVRRQVLLRQRAQGTLPAGEVSLALTRVPDTPLVNQPFIRLRGTAGSPFRIAAVRVDGAALFIETADTSVPIDHRLWLGPGEHTVRVEAEDLAGGRSRWETRLTVDTQGPRVSVSPAGDAARPQASLWLEDDVALAALSVDGVPQPLPPATRTFEALLPLPASGHLRIEATDTAGNRTELDAEGESLRQALLLPPWRDAPCLLAAGGSLPGHALADGGPGLVRTRGAAPADHTQPEIRLFPEVTTEVTVTTEWYVVDVLAGDAGGLAAVAVTTNGGAASRLPLPRSPALARCAQRVDLRPGWNRLDVEATDRAGNRAVRTLRVERRLNALWREDLRMAAAVLTPDLTAVPPLAKTDLLMVLTSELLRHPRRLCLVERRASLLGPFSREWQLADGNLADESVGTRPAAVKPAEWLLQGYASAWSGRDNWDVVVNVVDVASGQIILTTDVHGVGYTDGIIRFEMAGLVEKLKQQLPAISAPLRQASGGQVEVALGRRAQILPGMRFVFVPAAAGAEAETADPLTCDGRRVEGQVREVGDSSCVVEVVPHAAVAQLPPATQAILR